MNYAYRFILCTLLYSLYNQGGTTSESESKKKVSKQKKTYTTATYLKEHNPTQTKCRPGVRATSEKPEFADDSLTVTIEGAFACMLAGHKHIYWGFKDELEDLPKNLLQEHKIAYIIYPAPHAEELLNLILYTPKGKQNALLLLKSDLTQSRNPYSNGYLLGYSADDIKAFYDNDTGNSPEEITKLLNDDKAATATWLKEHTPSIEKWAHDKENIAKYKIEFGGAQK